MKYCDVLIEDSHFFQDTLTYKSSDANIQVGARVEVLVRNRPRVGFVMSIYDPVDLGFDVLEIKSIIDEEAIINEELMALAKKMAYYYVSPSITCFQTILPSKLKPQSNRQSIKMIRILRYEKDSKEKLSKKQSEFMDLIREKEKISYTQARKIYTGVRSLIDKGLISEYEVEAMYESQEVKQEKTDIVLNQAQKNAVNKVKLGLAHTYLLHGVTGSGKTEVYLQVAKKVLKNNQQVLIMVPEISLTPQMIDRVSKRFGRDVAIYHSALNEQEKYEQYNRVKNNQVKIVVGTRSSIFLPFKNLGLIVLDEEHDSSYKQQNIPYYHARDIAAWRQEYHQCPVILGSASPSLESYARALKSVYTLINLPDRINYSFPKVTLVDTQKTLYNQEGYYITDTLEKAIRLRLDRNEQVVLLLNRRGYLPILRDAKTQQVLECPNCDVALNYHKFDKVLRCHICAYQTNRNPDNAKIIGQGMGTERLTEFVESKFPDARVLRMDADTTRTKGSHQRILDSFINHEYDILIGTQMIAKGLDIENVTLVGVVNADAGLAHTDYRSVEQSFATLLQAAGRSGRGSKEGEVIMQSFNPDHYAIVCAVNQKYKHFFKQEMEYRKLASYPPYSYLISIVFYDENLLKAHRAADEFDELMQEFPIQKIGPTIIRRLSNRHRVRIILKGKDLDYMIQKCNEVVEHYRKINRTRFTVDVNPMSLES